MTSRFSLVDDPTPHEETDQVRMMADMAQIVAHRIRGLVTTLEGFTDLLADTLSSREQRELALRIFESAARIESVLADLQMFARPVRPVPVSTSLEAVLADLSSAVPEDIVPRLELVPCGTDTALRVDRMLIRQALLVLVQNAAEASERDDGVVIRCDCSDEAVQIHIENRGVLHPDVQTNSFKPFFTTKAHNLGVGLSIASRIAEGHGGSVGLLYSEPERGTCFTLTLPIDWAGEVDR